MKRAAGAQVRARHRVGAGLPAAFASPPVIMSPALAGGCAVPAAAVGRGLAECPQDGS